jgi:hypothetical protein
MDESAIKEMSLSREKKKDFSRRPEAL